LRFGLAARFQIVGGANGLTAVHLDLRRDLAVKQDQCNVPGGVMLLTKCESADTVIDAHRVRYPLRGVSTI
jgi:hypothetical protein